MADAKNTLALELVNRYAFLKPWVQVGFIPYIPEFDKGVDFIIYREAPNPADDVLIKVQLKGRWTIDRKYLGRNIWIAFPNSGSIYDSWYLVPHDKMVRHALNESSISKSSRSWIEGSYNRPYLPPNWAVMYSGFETSELIRQIKQGQSIAYLTENGATRDEWPAA